MTKEKAVKTGTFIGHVMAGGLWSIYIGGILSMLGHTFITPLPITSLFITMFGWYAIFMTVFVVLLIIGMATVYKKNPSDTLKKLWKTDIHNKSNLQIQYNNYINIVLSVFSLFIMKDMTLFLKLFPLTVVTSLLTSQMKEYIKEIKKNEGIYKLSDNIQSLTDILKKLNNNSLSNTGTISPSGAKKEEEDE